MFGTALGDHWPDTTIAQRLTMRDGIARPSLSPRPSGSVKIAITPLRLTTIAATPGWIPTFAECAPTSSQRDM